VAGNYFIVLNTNSLEFEELIPDMNFMRQAFTQSEQYQNTFVLSHVPPFDNDFDKSLTSEFTYLIRTHQVSYSIHGHQHNFRFSQPFNDGQNYLVVDTIQNRNFTVITVIGKQVSFEKIDF
jgi:calcineurin-like phosphoesterase family protein